MDILGEPLYEITIDTLIQVTRIIEECESLRERSHSTALGNERSESPYTTLLTKISPRAIQNSPALINITGQKEDHLRNNASQQNKLYPSTELGQILLTNLQSIVNRSVERVGIYQQAL